MLQRNQTGAAICRLLATHSDGISHVTVLNEQKVSSSSDVDAEAMHSWYRRWESAERWYEASFGPDLFGTPVLTCRWGALRTARGGMKCHLPGDAREAARRLQAMSRLRARHGYRIVASRP